jgi:hypothetical protein
MARSPTALGLTAFNAAAIGKFLNRERFLGPTSRPVIPKPQDRKKVTYFPWVGLAFFSNRCLNFNRPFETNMDGFERW